MCWAPTQPGCVLGAEAGGALSTQTFVVESPEEGVSVCPLEKGVLDLHLPPAQLLAAREPLRQRQDAPPLLQLLLDGIQPLLRGLRGCPQPRALQNKHGSAQEGHGPPLQRVSNVTAPALQWVSLGTIPRGTKRSCCCKGRINTTTQRARLLGEVEKQLLPHDLLSLFY